MNDTPQVRTGRERLDALTSKRESAFPAALRHTARVARLRRWILWGAGGVMALVAIGLIISSLKFLPVDLRLARVAMKGSQIVIDSPKLVGYQKDGRPYEVRAKTGVQDIAAPDVIDLDHVEVLVENSANSTTSLTAVKGMYSTKADRADMSGGVIIHDPKKFNMRLDTATMDFKSSKMTSNKPVIMKLEGGEITAKGLEFSQNESHALFSGGVHSTLYGEGAEPSNAFHATQ